MTANPPAVPEVLLRSAPALNGPAEPAPHQTLLPLATEGVLRYVWESRFGPMLIEAAHGEVFVNGERVLPFAAPPPSRTPSL
jgi:hypothetical protein